MISVKGGNKTQRELIEIAITFYARKLMKGSVWKPVECRVDLRRRYPRYTTSRKGVGATWYQPRFNIIDINISISFGGMAAVAILAHEMIHANQFLTGLLINHDTGGCTWKTTEYSEALVKMVADPRYLPWEKQAYAGELTLFNKFAKHYGLENMDDPQGYQFMLEQG